MSILDEIVALESRAETAEKKLAGWRRRFKAFKGGAYDSPGQQVGRRIAESTCGDPDCNLSFGLNHAGECEPCKCGLMHAAEECSAGRHVAWPTMGESLCRYRTAQQAMTWPDVALRDPAYVTCGGCRASLPGLGVVAFCEWAGK